MELEKIRELQRRIDGTWTLSILAQLAASKRMAFTELLGELRHPDTGVPICRQALANALVKLRERGVVLRDDSTIYSLTAEGRHLVAILQEREVVYATMAPGLSEPS